MRLFSSLNTGRESLLTHGTALSGAANDIANVSTPGFKDQRLEFADLLAASEGSLYGLETQAGNGVQAQDLLSIHNQGSLEFTERSLDVGIEGNGFFVVQNGEDILYTRAGNFQLNEEGVVVSSNGQPILGFTAASPDVPAPININDVNAEAEATTEASLTGNLDVRDAPVPAPANPQTFAELEQASAFSTSLEVIDSLGASHDVLLHFFKDDQLNYTVNAYVDGEEVGGVAGVPQQVGTTTLGFQANGQQPEGVAVNMAIAAAWSNGAEPSAVGLDLSTFSGFANNSFVSLANRNGVQAGSVLGNDILPDGTILAVLDSGDSAVVGRFALAQFASPAGLTKSGDNGFLQSAASGEPDIGNPNEDGRGALQGGALELSTVDLSREFIDVIRFQRAYQAGSSVIQTTNTLLDTTLQLA